MEEILSRAVHQSGIKNGNAVLVKRSVDSRKRPVFVYNLDVYGPMENIEKVSGFRVQNVKNKTEVHIIGCGPAGIFAAMQLIELGYKPVILERGKDVRSRRFDLADLVKNHNVNENSNYCFGEGGAGTFSDGKLYTRSKKRGPVTKILTSLVEHGATPEILWEAHPHIGTNKLPQIIENYRKTIQDCGAEIVFNCKISDFIIEDKKVTSVISDAGDKYKIKNLVLATGHSGREIFELLNRKKVAMEIKPFALGVRLEHHQELIDTIQYHSNKRPHNLPAASYGVVEQIQGRGVFSFCMCPGGIIAPAGTKPGEVVVNGWSPSKRNGEFANSGFVVSVDEKDFIPFNKHGVLAGMYYQGAFEQLAFETCNNLTAPAQRIEDFIQNRYSQDLPDCSYLPGIASRKIDEVLSKEVSERIRQALIELGKKMRGFRTNEAVLVGVESRTSSPVKILRNKDSLQHPQIENLYPGGEGAGFAGGIMSAALDGLKIAHAIHKNTQ